MIMRRMFFLMAGLAAALAVAGEDKEYVPSISSIKVNGDTVPAETIRGIYDFWLRVYKGPGKQLPNNFRDKIASIARDQAVRNTAVRQYLNKMNVTVAPEQLKTDLDEFKTTHIAPGGTFEEFLKARGQTEDDFMKEFVQRAQLTRVVAAETDKDLDAVKRSFEKEKEKMPLRRASQIRFSYEKTKFTAHPELGKEDARKQAAYALVRVKKGEDFAGLAKQLSDETVSRDAGGDLGWIAPTFIPKPVADAVYALEKIGDAADLIESEQGFHIVKMTDIKSEDKAFAAYLKQHIFNQTLAAENHIASQAKVEGEKPADPVKTNDR